MLQTYSTLDVVAYPSEGKQLKAIYLRDIYTYPNRILKGSKLCIRNMRKKSTVNRFFCLLNYLSLGN